MENFLSIMRRLLRYIFHLCAAVCVFSLGGCHSVHKAVTAPQGVTPVSQLHVSAPRQAVVTEAETWLGTPYKYAGAEKGKGADCSGLVMRVYLDLFDMKLPRNSAKQAEYCIPLKAEDVLAGDLVFFATGKDPNQVSHVGIMLDDVNFIHASSSKGVVISKVNTPYYTRTFMMYGRVPHFK